ncbi:MAG: hypothetical protein AAFZ07_19540 [Actinomycetota bacterium]
MRLWTAELGPVYGACAVAFGWPGDVVDRQYPWQIAEALDAKEKAIERQNEQLEQARSGGKKGKGRSPAAKSAAARRRHKQNVERIRSRQRGEGEPAPTPDPASAALFAALQAQQ